jgi:hypothetical protein
MAEALKILGQLAPAATTLGTLYAVPAATSTTVSSIGVCNRDATATTFRISIAPAGAADGTTQYLYYDVSLPGNDTFVATIGATLGTTDQVRCYAGHGSVTFSAFGIEVS